MGADSKALLDLQGSPMIDHVIRRLLPQVDSMCISVEGDEASWSEYGFPLVRDVVPGHAGPLAGLYSAMLFHYFRDISANMLVCPCDAPFIPPNLALRLSEGMADSERLISVIRYQDELQPTFSLWNPEVFPQLEQAVTQHSLRGIKQFLATLPYAAVDWEPQEPNPFFNVNTQDDLQRAERLLDPAILAADDALLTESR
jgi:molybdopterin-guanine dinucleotide biosynthesis protein A